MSAFIQFKDLTLDIDHLKFFICHGHLFHIDESPYELEAYASNHHLDVVCFGKSTKSLFPRTL